MSGSTGDTSRGRPGGGRGRTSLRDGEAGAIPARRSHCRGAAEESPRKGTPSGGVHGRGRCAQRNGGTEKKLRPGPLERGWNENITVKLPKHPVLGPTRQLTKGSIYAKNTLLRSPSTHNLDCLFIIKLQKGSVLT